MIDPNNPNGVIPIGSAASVNNPNTPAKAPIQATGAYSYIAPTPPKPPIPDALYQSAQQAVSGGTMTPAQAVSYLQSYTSGTNAQYSGEVNTGKLFPAGFTYKDQNGIRYQIPQAGAYSSPVKMDATVQNTVVGQNGTSTSTTPGVNGGINIQPTGNPSLDAALGPVTQQAILAAQSGQLPANLQVTPALIGKFLAYAHAYVDPQTQMLLSAESANINATLKNLQTQYENTQAGILQGFGTNLANEQNAAGNSGTAFSGQRNLNEQNMAASTNRDLSTNAANASLAAGNALRAGAEKVGAPNTGMFNLPTLAGAGQVSNQGGARGSYTPSGNSLDFGYNPNLYTTGTIPSQQASELNKTNQDYLSQYYSLASKNPTRSMNDLLGGITNVPAGQSTSLT